MSDCEICGSTLPYHYYYCGMGTERSKVVSENDAVVNPLVPGEYPAWEYEASNGCEPPVWRRFTDTRKPDEARNDIRNVKPLMYATRDRQAGAVAWRFKSGGGWFGMQLPCATFNGDRIEHIGHPDSRLEYAYAHPHPGPGVVDEASKVDQAMLAEALPAMKSALGLMQAARPLVLNLLRYESALERITAALEAP